MPDYERLLQETAARAATRIDADDARRIYREMRALYHRSLRQGIPDMADFLLQLHPEQIAHLERKFAEENARTAREILKGTPRERREAAAKRYLERIEDWTGTLSQAQREQVRARVAAMQDIADEWMDDRRFRQAETLGLIRARPPREAMIAALTRILVDTDSWRRPEYVAKVSARDERAYSRCSPHSTRRSPPEQRAKAHREAGRVCRGRGVPDGRELRGTASPTHHFPIDLNFSIAATSLERMPGSNAECPASGTTWYSASGQARCRSSAVTGGHTDVVASLHDHRRDVADADHVREQEVVRAGRAGCTK